MLGFSLHILSKGIYYKYKTLKWGKHYMLKPIYGNTELQKNINDINNKITVKKQTYFIDLGKTTYDSTQSIKAIKDVLTFLLKHASNETLNVSIYYNNNDKYKITICENPMRPYLNDTLIFPTKNYQKSNFTIPPKDKNHGRKNI